MNPLQGHNWEVHVGNVLDVLPTLEEGSVQCCVTSPPYWGLRDYSVCDCSQQRHASQAALEMCRTIVPGASGQSSATDKRCRKEPDPNCKACRGSGKIIGVEGHQLGLEKTPEEFVSNMVAVFRKVWRVLRDDGTCWVNLGDSYHGSWGNSGRRPELDEGAGGQRDKNAEYFNRGGWDERRERPPSSYAIPGLKPKDLCMIPARFALAMQESGWYLRSEIIWCKTSPMPESVRDRPTNATEKIFLFTKRPKYFYDQNAERPSPATYYRKGGNAAYTADGLHTNGIGSKSFHQMSESGRNLWNYWTDIRNCPYPDAHFATFPPDLPARCIRLGTKDGDTVLDPFSGSGTTGEVATELGRKYIGIELNPEYAEMSRKRIDSWKKRDAQKQVESLPGQRELFA